ncbi:MAG: hypothetical protein M0P35_05900 [Bacteroidales bacterium]|nr:hypothetical protein [Bacteroidales bacterium]
MKNYISLICFLLIVVLYGCSSGRYLAVTENDTNKTPLSPQQVKATSDFISAIGAKLVGNNSKAISLLEKCVEIDAQNDAVWYELSKLYADDYLLNKAVECAEKTTKIDNNNIYYLKNLARMYEINGQKDLAIKVYKKLVDINPNDLDLQVAYTNLLLSSEYFDETMRQLDKMESLIGVTEDVSLKKIKLYTYSDKTQKIVDEFQKLIETYPDSMLYINMLADYYLANGNEKEAFKCYGKILEIDPSNPYMHVRLAKYYRDKEGNSKKVFDELNAAFLDTNMDTKTKIAVILDFFSVEDILKNSNTDALNLIKTIHQTHPDDPHPTVLLADYYLYANQLGAARQYYYEVLDKDYTTPDVFLRLMYIENYLHNDTAVVALCEKAINMYPLIPDYYLFYGSNLYAQKKYEDALFVYKEGVMMVTDNDTLKADFYCYIGDCYYAAENKKDAYDSYDKSLLLNANNAYLLNNYSYYLSTSGQNLDKAEIMAKKAVELSPKSSHYLDTYAWALFKKGKYEEASKYVRLALDYIGDDKSVVLEHYGDILWNLNETEKAVKEWQKAYDTAPDSASEILIKKIRDKSYYE